MKRTKIRYIRKWGSDIYSYPIYRTLPHRRSRLTGRYREINGCIEVEVSEWYLFGWKSNWVSEGDFTFTEIEEFNCHEYKTDKQ